MNRLVALTLLACVVGCSKDTRTRIVVYSPHGIDVLEELEKQFEAKHPDIDVRSFNLSTGELLARVRGERDNPSADVWWGAPMATFRRAADEGLLAPYEPTYASKLTADQRDPQKRFHGHFAIPQVILYNRDRLSDADAPKHWDDLIGETYRDRVVLRFPLPSGSMRTSFSWLVAWKGKEANGSAEPGFAYLTELHRNTKRYATDPQELFEAIAKDAANVVTIWNLTDAIFQRDRYGYPFAVSIPSEGVPVVIDCIGLVSRKDADAARAQAARDYVEFVTSLDACEYLAKNHGRVPLRSDFEDARKPDWLKSLHYTPLPIDIDLANTHEDEWMRRWDETVKPKSKP